MARRTQIISSASNPLIKDVSRAVSRGVKTSDGLWVAESFHLLEEALRSGLRVEAVLASRAAVAEVEAVLNGRGRDPLRVVDDSLFARMSGTETTQGVIALVRPPKWKIDQLFEGCSLVVVLDAIQDPGNAGAILRSAEALGATGTMLLSGTARSANPKTLRASAGSLFRLPCVEGVTAGEACEELAGRGVHVLATVVGAGRGVGECDFSRPSAIVFGSEAHGVSDVVKAAGESVHIPTRGVESLNVAAAAAVILYEASRQRGSQGKPGQSDAVRKPV